MRLALKEILVGLLLFYSVAAQGQDIHFSQFESTPLNLSPAQTGSFDHDYRAVLNHRNQWQSVTVPYLTVSASFDAKTYFIQSIKPDFLAFGLLFNGDKAGDGNLGTTQIKFSSAYHHQLNGQILQAVTFGINAGYNYQSIDYTKFYFGSQFNGFQYDPNLYSGEVFTNNQLRYFDFSAGLQTTGKFDTLGFVFGMVYHHLNHPLQTFNNVSDGKIDGKLNTYLFVNIKMDTKNFLLPSLVWYRQGVQNEFDVGGLYKHRTNNMAFQNVFVGGWLRWKDAAIVKFGFDYRNFTFGVSYDLNFSKLYVASRGNGGYELSLIYQFDKALKQTLPYLHNCPTYF